MNRMQRALSELFWILLAAAFIGTAVTFLHPRKPVLSFEPRKPVPELPIGDLEKFAGGGEGEAAALVIALAGRGLVLPEQLKRFPSAELPPDRFDEGLERLLEIMERAAPGAAIAVAGRASEMKSAEAVAKRVRDEAGFGPVFLLPLR